MDRKSEYIPFLSMCINKDRLGTEYIQLHYNKDSRQPHVQIEYTCLRKRTMTPVSSYTNLAYRNQIYIHAEEYIATHQLYILWNLEEVFYDEEI